MSSEPWDAVVIGAGPAGALSACLLARRGLRVLLVERCRMPRRKSCGGCLNGRGLAVLGAHGLEATATGASGVPLRGIRFHRFRQKVVIKGDLGVALDRSKFDVALAEHAMRAGAILRDGAAATVLPVTDRCLRRIALACGGAAADVVSARVVIAADGLGHPSLVSLPEFRSRVAPRSLVGIGVVDEAELDRENSAYPPGELNMAVGEHGYLGVTRLADGRLCIGAAVDPRVVRGGGPVRRWMGETVAACGLPPLVGLPAARVHGTPLLTRREQCVAAHRLFAVGDAAGYIEPITGEGMAWALTGAHLLVPLAAAACADWKVEYIDRWQRLLRRAKAPRQGVNWALAAALRRPLLARVAFAAAAWPSVSATLVRSLHEPFGISGRAA